MRIASVPFALLACLLLGSLASASPAMPSREDVGDSMTEQSFGSFAEEWMGRALARGTRDSKAPRAHSGSAGLIFTYHAVAEDFETELRPTGRPSSPYVGVLHYTEQTFTCRDVLGAECTATSSLPVTEVFRYRAGRWGY